MSDKIIDFRPKVAIEPVREPNIWVCTCGCSTFNLLEDGIVKCAMCEEVSHDGYGGWAMPNTTTMWDGDPPIHRIEGNGSVEFAKCLVLKHAGAEDAALLAVVNHGGTIHVWSVCETEEQIVWARDRLDAVKELVMKHASADTEE
jgi:hypothetical protein